MLKRKVMNNNIIILVVECHANQSEGGKTLLQFRFTSQEGTLYLNNNLEKFKNSFVALTIFFHSKIECNRTLSECLT